MELPKIEIVGSFTVKFEITDKDGQKHVGEGKVTVTQGLWEICRSDLELWDRLMAEAGYAGNKAMLQAGFGLTYGSKKPSELF